MDELGREDALLSTGWGPMGRRLAVLFTGIALVAAGAVAWLPRTAAAALVVPDLLTSEEREWLRAHPVLRLAPDPNFPPLEYFDEKGRYRGLVADYYPLIEARLGIRFEVVRVATWDEVLEKARRREVDIVGAAQKTPARSEYLSFTQPILDIPNVIIVRKDVEGSFDFEKLAGKTVAITRGNALDEYVRSRYPAIHVAPEVDDLHSLTEVSFGRADAAVVNLAIAAWLIDRHGITNLRLAGDSGRSNPLHIATRSDWPILNSILAKGLATITEEERNTINGRWIRLGSPTLEPEAVRKILAAAVLAGLLLAAVLLINRSLRRQVASRTAALTAELAERRRVEEELRRTSSLLDSIVENLPEVVFVKRADDMRYVLFNRTGEEVMGLPRDHFIGHTDVEIFPSEAAALIGEKDRLALSRPGEVEVYEEELETGHKGRRLLRAKKIALGDESGSRFLLGIVEDITERRQAENAIRELNVTLEERVHQRTEQLQAALRELESFSYSVSHDLRAPLRAFDGYSKILIEDYGGCLDSTAHAYLDRMRSASQRMGGLIDGLLELARLSRFELAREPVDVSAMVQDLRKELESVKPDGSSRQVAWNIQPEVVAYADPTAVRSIVGNLVLNAWKFTRQCETAEIYFSAERHDGMTVYCVRDNGAGFDMAYAEKLFMPFQRLHRQVEFEGTGIGLATVQRLVARHGGRIWAESAPDQGAAFFFTLSGGTES